VFPPPWVAVPSRLRRGRALESRSAASIGSSASRIAPSPIRLCSHSTRPRRYTRNPRCPRWSTWPSPNSGSTCSTRRFPAWPDAGSRLSYPLSFSGTAPPCLGLSVTSASSATSCRLSRSGACPCLACGPTSTLPVSSIREHRQEVSNRNRSTLPKQARTLEVCAPVTPPGSPRSIGDAARTANAQRSRLSRCPERRLDGTASNATGRSPDRTPPPGMPPAGINEEQEST
jgi:hypothetical protein